MTTVEEIVLAIDALPVADRLRVIERVVHEMAFAAEVESSEDETQAIFSERGGFLIIAGEPAAPLELFDHRVARDERTTRLARAR